MKSAADRVRLPSPAVLRSMLARLGVAADESEIAVANDFRLRLSHRFDLRRPIESRQRTTSLLHLARQRGTILRRSAVRSGWADWKALERTLRLPGIAPAREPAAFALNGPAPLPRVGRASGFAAALEGFHAGAAAVLRRLRREFRPDDFGVNFFFSFDRFLIENTAGLSGSYEHPYVRLEYRLRRGDREAAGLLFDPTPDEAVRDVTRAFERSFLNARAAQTGFLRSGQLPAVIAPRVTALLAQILFEQSKAAAPWPEHYAEVFPAAFRLEDDPTAGIGQSGVPFDHEGTPTRRKLLVDGGRAVEKVSDLQSAAAAGVRSSGNGFRRGLFVSHLADLTPSVQPAYLRVSPGETPLAEALRTHPEFVYLSQVSFPVDRFAHLVRGQGLVTIEGVYVRGGKVASNIVMKNHADRPLISGYPRSYGSLVDPSTLILADGEATYAGWYPYLLLPRMTWRESD